VDEAKRQIARKKLSVAHWAFKGLRPLASQHPSDERLANILIPRQEVRKAFGQKILDGRRIFPWPKGKKLAKQISH
jgi:hypothetical protein